VKLAEALGLPYAVSDNRLGSVGRGETAIGKETDDRLVGSHAPGQG